MARADAKRCNSAKAQEKEGFSVKIMIVRADNIDGENMGRNGQPRVYQVFGSLGPGIEFMTCKTEGKPDPIWKWPETLELDRFPGEDLEIEVLRVGSKTDPGTSTGMVLVGRAIIALPNTYNKCIKHRVGLVKPVGEGLYAEGHMTVLTMIERFKSTGDGMWRKA